MEQHDELKSLREIFVKMMSLNSVDNRYAAEIYFHAFMGAYLKDILVVDGISRKDLRQSVTWFQSSRTGKGRMNKAFQMVARYNGLSCEIITQYNVAGIIGTINESAVKHNQEYAQHGLSQINPVIEIENKGKKKTITWQDPIIKGDAGTTDILIFDELSMLLRPKKDNEEILMVLQPALDYPPHVRKKMKFDIPIEYSHPITIIGTTFPIALSKIISTAGYLQRTFIFYRILTIDDIKAMHEEEQKIMRPGIQQEFDNLQQLFKQRLEKIDKTPRTINISNNAKLVLGGLVNHVLDKADKQKGLNREIMISFSNTMKEFAIKCAAQYVIINGKGNEIDGIDIKRSHDLIDIFIDTMVNKIDIKEEKENVILINNVIRVYKNLQKTKININHMDFVRAINVSLNIGMIKAGKLLHGYVDQGYFKMKVAEDNKTYHYILNEE